MNRPVGTKRRVRAEKVGWTLDGWLSVQVDLVYGHGEPVWPRPGRRLAASPAHTFAQLAYAIDDAFARWDRSHLHQFEISDGSVIGIPDIDFDVQGKNFDERKMRLSVLKPGEHFAYVFDLGDEWEHLCTVGKSAIDPLTSLGIIPDRPLPYFGWGAIPDQYGRRWSDDDGEDEMSPDPKLRDLPPLRPGWGGTIPHV